MVVRVGADIHALRPRSANTPQPQGVIDLVQYPTGDSPAARTVRAQISQVAHFSTTVLVLGESGTGKELAASQVHALSGRSQGPFVPVNCGAIPAELLESELFGHERGAFTGAIGTRHGRFEMAQHGTIFLDEIGEMSPCMQVKILRVLQQKTFERVGSSQTRTADVRIVAATNRNLEAEVQAGRFREDLFFRLNVFPIQMPALRERCQDLAALIDGFHIQLEERGHEPVELAPMALQALKRYRWPGNVRELENLLERLSVLLPGARVELSNLPERYRTVDCAAAEPEPLLKQIPTLAIPIEGLCLKTLLGAIERDFVQQALTRSNGVVSQAARLLGVGRTTLLEKIRRLQLN